MTETTTVGEIIEAGTAEFTAQCYELYQSPPLGSLVKTGDSAAASYGIVYHATTTSLEPGRRPIARGKDEVSEEAIYQSSPQLAKLLRSEFSALVVGHRDGDTLRHYLPPQPAHIHSFVYQCPPEEIKEFSQSMTFLNILLSHPLPLPTDEVIAACLRHMSQVHEDPHAFLVASGRELAILLGGEFKQLKIILDKVRL
ncbi:hypothetical protein ACFLW8_03725 [Chloroflexota bacterium]